MTTDPITPSPATPGATNRGLTRPGWRRVRRRLAAVVAAGALLAACGGDDDAGGGTADGTGDGTDAPAAQPFTVMLNWTPNAHHLGVYVADQRGWYAEAGLDVRIVQPGSDGVLYALAAGEADIGFAVAEGLLPARLAELPVVSVAAVVPSNDSSLLALAESGITRPSDLEGRRYGGYGGALETELIGRLVTCDGGDPDAVEMIEIGDVDYLVGMEQGHYDVVWVFSGWDGVRATAVEDREIAEIRFADHLDCIPDWYTPLLAASEDALADDDRRDALETFLEVTARGYDAGIEDPAAAADDLLAGAPETDSTLIHAAAEYYAPLFVVGDEPWGRQDPEVWTEFEEFLREAGLLEGAVDVDAAFTNELVD